MKLLFKIVLIWLMSESSITLANAEPYHLIAGTSALGFRENDKQNVNLGFNSAFNALLSSENVKCDFKMFETSDELATAIAHQEVNSFFGSPLEYIKAESFLMSSPLASGIFGHKLKSKIFLLVRKDSGIYTLEQLKGKKLSTQKFASSDVAGLYTETLLLEHHLPQTKEFFSEVQNSETSNTAFVNLFFKKVDATLISETQFEIATELNPQLLKDTKILEASEPYLNFLAAFSKSTPEQEITGIKNSLFTVHKTTKGRNILNLMKLQGFQEISVNELDNVRALLEKNKRLKAQNAH